MNCECLINKKIINILIGDEPVFENIGMPYMSGPDLCTLCTTWGLPFTYEWRGTNLSRWQYLQKLLIYLNKQDRVEALLGDLCDFSHFEYLQDKGTADEVKSLYHSVVNGAISKINAILLFSQKQLRIVNQQFVLCQAGEEPVIVAPKVKVVTYQYIRELPERIKEDFDAKDYDSVITKSRTLLEEVLIYIIEQTTHKMYRSNGDLLTIYNEVRDLLGLKSQSDWDKRVNELLGGVYKVVNSIASMRNINSDAHGSGSRRVQIYKREALLIANSAMMIAEYWLSVFNREKE